MIDIERTLAGRYTIERELGRGGMGAVYLARDLTLDRLVALKVLPPEFATNSALRERFLRETRTAASFSHPNIVPVHSVEEHDGVLAFAMGFVEGESLAERVRRQGALDARSVAKLLTDVAYALAYAHGRGVVHRDIKPDNIMIERATGRALLMDFGISRSISNASVEAAGLTRVGEVVGTPEYMSPEQATGDQVDGRSDLYSLGLVALFALTARPVITGDSTQQIIVRQLTEVLPPTRTLRADTPAALAEAIDRCVMKDPAQRFVNAESLVEALDRAQLAAPEVPLAIRLFAHEAGTLGLVLTFFAIIIWLMIINASGNDFDALLPAIVLFGVAITRVMQVNAEARRLAMAGFSMPDVLKGLTAVVDEREALREQLRPNAEIQHRRRRTVMWAIGMLLVSAVLFYLALESRIQIAPNRYRVALGGMTMVITSLILFGVSLVLLIRSPFRMPVGERVFRRVWLGGFGRWFLRRAARGVSPSSTASTGTTGATTAVANVTASASSNGTTLADLEQRVRALEQWRRTHSGSA